MGKSPLVCLLIIGKSEPMSSMVIRSIRSNFCGQFLIGYVDMDDISQLELPLDTIFFDLSSKLEIRDKSYKGFHDPDFYQIVQLKWNLISHAMSLGYSTIIYTDLDVFWLRDASQTIIDTFASYSHLKILIQSFTRGTELPCLCMGFIALRVDESTSSFIDLCRETHAKLAENNPMLGDDEVVSQVFRELNYPGWIRELPQSTFPTGNLYPLYLIHRRYRKMEKISPYIVHLNYVVGFNNKLLFLTYLKLFTNMQLEFVGVNKVVKILFNLIKQNVLRRI